MSPPNDIISLIAFSFDNDGSRFVSEKLNKGSDDLRIEYFNEILPFIREISASSLYSHQIFKYYFQSGNQQQFQELVTMLVNNFKELSVNKFGSHVVEFFIEKMTLEEKSIVIALSSEEIVNANSHTTYVI